MARFLSHKEIDKSKWDEVVCRSDQDLIFNYSWYLDIASPGWCAVVKGDYVELLPLQVKDKFGVSYAKQTMFIPYCGVNITEEGIREIIGIVEKQNSYVDIYINPKASPFLITEGNELRFLQFIDLTTGYKSIQDEYSKNLKRILKDSPEFTIESSTSNELINYFKLNLPESLEELSSKDYIILLNLMEEANIRDKLIVRKLTINENICAMAGFFKHGERLTFVKGTSNELGREKNANHILFDQLIKEYANGMKVFDFGGSSVDGVRIFNKKFGAKEVSYAAYKMNNLPFPVNKLMER